MITRCMPLFLSVGLITSASLPRVCAELPPLIPRKVLFGNPVRAGYHLSPDGTRLSYIAPSEKGVANVWMQKLGDKSARMVTHDTHRGINAYTWAADGRHILYRQDLNGDENWHIYSTDLERPLVRDLTPFLGVRAQGVVTSSKRPNEILVDLNIRDKRVFDVYRVNLETGAVVLEAENPGDVLSWTTDEDFVVRACTAFGGDDAHTTIRVRDDAQSPVARRCDGSVHGLLLLRPGEWWFAGRRFRRRRQEPLHRRLLAR